MRFVVIFDGSTEMAEVRNRLNPTPTRRNWTGLVEFDQR
jgi:hypothetical protein